jgi:hypothetical protein
MKPTGEISISVRDVESDPLTDHEMDEIIESFNQWRTPEFRAIHAKNRTDQT